jgi:Plavaka transposase
VKSSEAYLHWKRGAIHDILRQCILPLQQVQEEGINLVCPDGRRRLCVPVLAQYLADYEEQRVLASIISGFCPKCTIPSNRRQSSEIPPGQPIPRSATGPNIHSYPARDGEEAKRLRSQFPMNNNRHNPMLSMHGYHHAIPFTEEHVQTDIYGVLAPDLLHQVTKCFFDYVHKWVIQIIAARKEILSEKAEGEIDARFTQLPPYKGLRAFLKGLSAISRWQGNEINGMLRVYLGVIKGIVPDSVVELVKTYMDVHRMSHYRSHTDSTLRDLDHSIAKFWSQLWDPDGPFVRNAGIQPGWHCPKLHYMFHYTDYIRRNGSLSFCSTNRTEAWHKFFKAAYRRSNKGHQCCQYCLHDEACRIAWCIWEESLPSVHQQKIPVGEAYGEYDGLSGDEESQSRDPSSDSDPAEALLNDIPEKAKCQKSITFTATKRRPTDITQVQKKLGVGFDSLKDETVRCLRWIQRGRTRLAYRKRARDTEWGEEELVISVRVCLKLTYPTVHDPTIPIVEHLHSTDKYKYSQNEHWIKPRRDTALIRYGPAADGGDTMHNRRVARILLLFNMDDLSGVPCELAFVQWFKTARDADRATGMFKVSKTDTFEVVELDSIERSVHLIPCFESAMNTQMASWNSAPALDVYSHFWLNNQIDIHMYNTIWA